MALWHSLNNRCLSVPKAYAQFFEEGGVEGGSRMLPGGNTERLLDCMEELVKYTGDETAFPAVWR